MAYAMNNTEHVVCAVLDESVLFFRNLTHCLHFLLYVLLGSLINDASSYVSIMSIGAAECKAESNYIR